MIKLLIATILVVGAQDVLSNAPVRRNDDWRGEDQAGRVNLMKANLAIRIESIFDSDDMI